MLNAVLKIVAIVVIYTVSQKKVSHNVFCSVVFKTLPIMIKRYTRSSLSQ